MPERNRESEVIKRIETKELLSHCRATLASVGDGVIVTDVESRITFINPAAERLTGWRKNDALYKQLTEIFQIVNEQSVKMESPALRAIKAGEAVSLPERAILIARDGSKWPVDDSAAPILDAAGRIYRRGAGFSGHQQPAEDRAGIGVFRTPLSTAV
jgi:PAS domain S-box-containing protein